MAAPTQEVSQGQKNSALIVRSGYVSATVHPAHYGRLDANLDANQCRNGNIIISIIIVVGAVDLPHYAGTICQVVSGPRLCTLFGGT